MAQRGTGTEASTPSRTPSAVTPSSSASARSRTRCRSAGPRERLDVVGGHVVAAREPRPRPGSREQRGRPARGDAERQRRRLAGGSADVDDVAERPPATTVTVATAARPAASSAAPATGRTPAAARSRGSKPALCRARTSISSSRAGRGSVSLSRKRSSCASGQRVGALVLDRVLRGAHDERVGQRSRHPVDGDLPLLHGLEQRRLRLRRRAVDLVGEQQVGEHRTGPEGELRRSGVVDERAGHVAGHQVRGELHALGVQGQRGGERADEQGLGDAGHALEEHVTAAQQRDDEAGDRGVLPDDGLADLGAQREERGTRLGPGIGGQRRRGRSVRDRRRGDQGRRLTGCWRWSSVGLGDGFGRGVGHGWRTCLSRASRSSASRTSAASSGGGPP